MKIVNDYPPNYEKICEVFDIRDKPTIIFTYGDTVYHPSGEELATHVKVHEATHVQQQKVIGADVWWDRYLIDPEFRLEQELQAYRAQYNTFKRIRNWREVEYLISSIAGDLASEMYGNVVTKAEARQLITTQRKKNGK